MSPRGQQSAHSQNWRAVYILNYIISRIRGVANRDAVPNLCHQFVAITCKTQRQGTTRCKQMQNAVDPLIITSLRLPSFLCLSISPSPLHPRSAQKTVSGLCEEFPLRHEVFVKYDYARALRRKSFCKLFIGIAYLAVVSGAVWPSGVVIIIGSFPVLSGSGRVHILKFHGCFFPKSS